MIFSNRQQFSPALNSTSWIIQSSVEFDQLDIVLVITNFRPLIFEQPNP